MQRRKRGATFGAAWRYRHRGCNCEAMMNGYVETANVLGEMADIFTAIRKQFGPIVDLFKHEPVRSEYALAGPSDG